MIKLNPENKNELQAHKRFRNMSYSKFQYKIEFPKKKMTMFEDYNTFYQTTFLSTIVMVNLYACMFSKLKIIGEKKWTWMNMKE